MQSSDVSVPNAHTGHHQPSTNKNRRTNKKQQYPRQFQTFVFVIFGGGVSERKIESHCKRDKRKLSEKIGSSTMDQQQKYTSNMNAIGKQITVSIIIQLLFSSTFHFTIPFFPSFLLLTSYYVCLSCMDEVKKKKRRINRIKLN